MNECFIWVVQACCNQDVGIEAGAMMRLLYLAAALSAVICTSIIRPAIGLDSDGEYLAEALVLLEELPYDALDQNSIR